MTKRINNISGWVLTLLLGLLFALSSFLKLSYNPTALAQASSMGFDAQTYWYIGLIELTALVLFLIPKTGLFGSLLLIAYMGGAIATHLQHSQSIFVAVVVQALVWVSLALRYPDFLQQLLPAARKQIKQQ